MKHKTPWTTGTAVAVAAAAALTLSSCSSDSDSDSPASGSGTAPTSTSTPTSSAPTTSASTSASATAGAGSAQTSTALAAISTAETAVGTGTVFDLESDDKAGTRTWDAKVATSAGAQYSLTLDAAGTKVVSRRQDAKPDDDIAKLRSARITLPRAIAIAAPRAQGKGDLSSLEIDTSTHGSSTKFVVWQISFGGDSGTTVIVNATSGAVVQVGQDAG